MPREDTAVSLASLAIALVFTLVLFFGNFTLAYLIQALRGERIPLGAFAGTLLLTVLALGSLLWAAHRWWRAHRRSRTPLATTVQAESGPPPPPPGDPTPPPDGDGATSERWFLAQARARLLALAAEPDGFTLEQALSETALEPADLTFLIDELIGARRLRSEASGQGFRYLLRENEDAEPGDPFPH